MLLGGSMGDIRDPIRINKIFYTPEDTQDSVFQ